MSAASAGPRVPCSVIIAAKDEAAEIADCIASVSWASEVIVVETSDSVGPMGAKGIAESNVNPVAPALANALQDATGVRYRELPLTPERIYRRLVDNRLIPTSR